MVHNYIDKVLACEVCQKFAKEETRLTTFYTLITMAIPFIRWGMDILRSLPMASSNVKFYIVAIDYFTKWVEATPLATITEF